MSAKKGANDKLVRIKTKMMMVWLVLSILFLLISLSIMFGITTKQDWFVWNW